MSTLHRRRPALLAIAAGLAIPLAACAREAEPDAYGNFEAEGVVVSAEATGLAVDEHGAIYVAGGTHGAMDGPNQGGRDAFVVKYDAHGTRLWARQLGTPGMDEAHAVALTRAGDVVIAGYTTGRLGGAHAGGQDVFVARFNSRGQQ